MTDPIEAILGTYLTSDYGIIRDDALAIVAGLDAAGWAVVPKEPTDAAVAATGLVPGIVKASYRAMIEAGRVKP